MESKEIYTNEFKLNFLGVGEWVEEADWVDFEYNGIKCAVFRCIKKEPCCYKEAYFGGHLCGYIYLPKDHPDTGKPILELDYGCHGGITHAEETEKGYRIGFDCAHSADITPTIQK